MPANKKPPPFDRGCSLRGSRRRSPITQGSALVAFERSRLALAPLISSRRKYGQLLAQSSCPLRIKPMHLKNMLR
jgi:hypothetical protein